MNYKEKFWKQGFLHLPAIYNKKEIQQLTTDLEWMMVDWAENTPGWSGPWRKKYMDSETNKKSKLIAMHDLQFYTSSWMQAVIKPNLISVLENLIGPELELHHSTMHIKPPSTGHPFPMHQDWAFYKHQDSRFVDVLIHLDDTCHENGEIRFLEGSHMGGALKHVVQNEDGTPCTPHLPTEKYRLEDTVAVPAKKGDVVMFNINTIHGSFINSTLKPRKLVRVGYRNPDNIQSEGQSCGRPGLMIRGTRKRKKGDELFSSNGPKDITSADTFAVGSSPEILDSKRISS